MLSLLGVGALPELIHRFLFYDKQILFFRFECGENLIIRNQMKQQTNMPFEGIK
jgi:hypothetical protein